jgi:hypothetical protein
MEALIRFIDRCYAWLFSKFKDNRARIIISGVESLYIVVPPAFLFLIFLPLETRTELNVYLKIIFVLLVFGLDFINDRRFKKLYPSPEPVEEKPSTVIVYWLVLTAPILIPILTLYNFSKWF